MNYVVDILLYFFAVFFGGVFVGGAIKNYKNEEYGGCGLNIMLALTMVKLIFTF